MNSGRVWQTFSTLEGRLPSQWSEQPSDVRALFNPALVSLVVHSCADGFQSKTKVGLPFDLAFLATPLALSEKVRSELPQRTNTGMGKWLLLRPETRLTALRLCTRWAPVTRSGVLFGAASGLLTMERGTIRPAKVTPKHLAQVLEGAGDAVGKCIGAAGFAGKWFASQGSAKAVWTLFGGVP